jgi:hypothetical protein
VTVRLGLLACLFLASAAARAQGALPSVEPQPLSPGAASAAAPAPPRARQPERLTPRATPEDALAEIRADPAFRYDRPVSEQPSLWDRFLAWFFRHVIAPFFETSTTPGGRAIWFVVGALVLLAALLRIFRADLGGLFGLRDAALAAGAEPLLDVENIAEADLRTLLRRALDAEDWRGALRLRYLLALQTLAARGAIAWARDKTNRAYVAEVRQAGDAPLARAFADATRVFDYVWYGGLPVDAARHASLAARFERLDEALAAPRRAAARP